MLESRADAGKIRWSRASDQMNDWWRGEVICLPFRTDWALRTNRDNESSDT